MRRRCSPLSYPLFFGGVELTSRARSQCWSLRFNIHSCKHKHSEASDFWGEKRLYFLIFVFSLTRNELNGAGGCSSRGRLWWHGVVKQRAQPALRERLHCASCLNAYNQLEIYMTVVLHCLQPRRALASLLPLLKPVWSGHPAEGATERTIAPGPLKGFGWGGRSGC